MIDFAKIPHDVKYHRIKILPPELPDQSAEVKRARNWERVYRTKAAYWLNELQKMHGKLAMLKHENKTLRKKLNDIHRPTNTA